MLNLEGHHLKFRSHLGDDSELNLITLCAALPCAVASMTGEEFCDR